jgi:hypothetical protein
MCGEERKKQYFHTQNFDFVKVARSIELERFAIIENFIFFYIFFYTYIFLTPPSSQSVKRSSLTFVVGLLGNWQLAQKKMRIIKASKKKD